MAERKGKKKEEVNKKSLKEAINTLSTKCRIALALFTALSAVTLLFLFLFALITAVTPERVKKEDYQRVLSTLNKRTWTIKKGDEKTLALFLPTVEVQSAESIKNDSVLILHLKGGENNAILYFGYKDERIQGFVGSTLFSLYPSKGAITLLSAEAKIVFYEE